MSNDINQADKNRRRYNVGLFIGVSLYTCLPPDPLREHAPARRGVPQQHPTQGFLFRGQCKGGEPNNQQSVNRQSDPGRTQFGRFVGGRVQAAKSSFYNLVRG